MTEWQSFINIGAGAILSVMGWFARQLWDAVKELKSDLSSLREEIAKDYLAKDDFREYTAEVKSMLHRILDKLDNKEDKHG